MIPAWLLKLGAGFATMLAVIGSANYVAAHLKNGRAPLQPAVIHPAATAQPAPEVRSTDQEPVTSTHAS